MESLKKTISKNDILRVLYIRPFLSLMLSEFFSQTAFNMQHFVIIFVIYRITHSNTAVSGVILSFTIPAILFSLLAGVYVDRMNKKTVLFVTNFLRGIFLLFFLIPNLHLAFIYTLTFLIALATQFFLPAESSIIPLLIPKELLVSGNAVYGAGIYSTVLIGFVASGLMLLFFGKTVTFLFLAALFFLSALFILFIKIPEKKKIQTEVSLSSLTFSFAKDIKEVFSYMGKVQRVFQALMVLTLSQTIIFTFAVLGPGYVATILNVEVESLSWILLAPAAIGMVVGSLIVGSLGRVIRGTFSISWGFLISGAVFLFLPFGSRVASQGFIHGLNAFLPHFLDITMLHIIVFMAFIAGVANSLIYIPANTTVQRYTIEEIRGRIYGFLNALAGAVSLLPVVVAGGLADIFGMSSVITGIGILMLILGSGSLLFSIRLRS